MAIFLPSFGGQFLNERTMGYEGTKNEAFLSLQNHQVPNPLWLSSWPPLGGGQFLNERTTGYEGTKNEAFLSLQNHQVPRLAVRLSSPVRNSLFSRKCKLALLDNAIDMYQVSSLDHKMKCRFISLTPQTTCITPFAFICRDIPHLSPS